MNCTFSQATSPSYCNFFLPPPAQKKKNSPTVPNLVKCSLVEFFLGFSHFFPLLLCTTVTTSNILCISLKNNKNKNRSGCQPRLAYIQQPITNVYGPTGVSEVHNPKLGTQRKSQVICTNKCYAFQAITPFGVCLQAKGVLKLIAKENAIGQKKMSQNCLNYDIGKKVLLAQPIAQQCTNFEYSISKIYPNGPQTYATQLLNKIRNTVFLREEAPARYTALLEFRCSPIPRVRQDMACQVRLSKFVFAAKMLQKKFLEII